MVKNQSVALRVITRVGDGSFRSILKDVAMTMRNIKDNYPGINSALEIEVFGSDSFYEILDRIRSLAKDSTKVDAKPSLFGNIGIIPEEAVAFSDSIGVSNAFQAGIIPDAPGIALGLTTFRGKMTFTLGYPGGVWIGKLMDALIDRIIYHITMAKTEDLLLEKGSPVPAKVRYPPVS
jgi:NRPS condensation-like uncharacterized protein